MTWKDECDGLECGATSNPTHITGKGWQSITCIIAQVAEEAVRTRRWGTLARA